MIIASVREISSQPVLSYQLGLRPHTSGSSAPEHATVSLSFFGSDKPVTPPCLRSDQPVLATLLRQWQDSFLTYFGNSLLGRSGGAPIWGIPKFRVPGPGWTRKLHINCLELRAVISNLHHRVSVLQGC